MKKGLLGFFLCLGLTSVSHAGLFDATGDRTFHVVYSTTLAAATTSTSTLLIDLSDTVNWPHKSTREINISSIRVDVDKVAASTVTVRIGVFNMVNTATGSITWFYRKSFLSNVSNADNDVFVNYTPNFVRTRVEGGTAGSTNGTTPYLLSNVATSQSTSYQNDEAMPTANASFVAPNRGDIVLELTKTSAAAATFSVELDYNTPESR